MAAGGPLPEPGTEYGPCIDECHHVDCRETMRMAQSECPFCQKPIGFRSRYFAHGTTPDGLPAYAHAVCVWQDAERTVNS